MNKAELIDHIAENAVLSKAAATDALNAFMTAVTITLKQGDSVTLVGFGTFSLAERAARPGTHPRTGAMIEINAAKIPKFKAGKGLKDAVN